MQTANAELMRSARESLQGKWGLAIGVTVVYLVIIMALQSAKQVGPLASFLVSGPFAGGLAIFALTIARNREAKFEQLFDGFKRFGIYFVAYLLMIVFICLWSLLLIVPGIVAAFSYSMIFYIIADNPTISASDALKRSKEMMRGNKGKLFGLQLRFLGWAILCILTAGIGFLWLIPYIQVSTAKFYEDLKEAPAAPSAPAEPVAAAPVAPTAPTPFISDKSTETIEIK
ncbi:MAG TPA: DUF975 family protein [Candidatus Fimivivens sp.]|nr:DUF975 family protein [Candidatus Fimivivens sp.]